MTDDLISRAAALSLCDAYPYVEGVKMALQDLPAVAAIETQPNPATIREAARVLNAACDAMWNDHERIEKSAEYFAGQQPWKLKHCHIKAISEAQQGLHAALIGEKK